MKKLLKAIICCALVIVLGTSSLAFAATYKAIVPTFDVLVGGERFYSEPPVVVIDGTTYLPLRALGDALGVYVEWNQELGQVEVSTTKEVSKKTPALPDGYDKFDDVPDFGKITKTELIMSESTATDFGYVTSFGYSVSEEKLSDVIYSYMEVVSSVGFIQYFYDNSEGYESMLLFNTETGRMINLVLHGTSMVVSVFEQKHTFEEWEALNEGASLPQKKYDAVDAGFKVYVDGKEFVSEKLPVVVDDRTYLPLKAMGNLLGVSVQWNEEIGRVEVTK